jgi:hypothetical protein
LLISITGSAQTLLSRIPRSRAVAGSGRWVNRLPFDDGYKCIECLGSVFDCDRCGAPIPFDEDSVLTVAVAHPTNHDLTEDLRLGPCCHFEGFHN